jgi:coenzyme F420-reducing hydrogenase alpha subunit
MGKKIHLKKATRVEGNADIKIEIENGTVKSANFMVHDFRGFERFLQDRRVEFVPHLVSRICGLCSASQQIASLRAVEDALDIDVPATVRALREIALLGERIGSHSLSYFYLSMPDLLGVSGGIFEIMKSHPEISREALAMRKAGQDILQLISRRSVHPVSMGVGAFLDLPRPEEIEKVREIAADVQKRSLRLIEKTPVPDGTNGRIPFPDDIPVHHLVYGGITAADRFQILTREGEVQFEFDRGDFEEKIAEMGSEWSFAKLPYLKELGFPEGILLTGPLSRTYSDRGVLHDPEIANLPLAKHLMDIENLNLESYDICRLLEIYQAAKRVIHLTEELDLDCVPDPVKLDKDGYGVGVVEAPRGTLVHVYLVNNGLIERMHLFVATQFNNAYINLLLKDLAGHHAEGDSLTEEGEKLIGRCVRIFDPCLSCATH